MAVELTPEMRKALLEQEGMPLTLEDPQTHKMYVLVDQEKHSQAMNALQSVQDKAGIQEGIDQMLAGEGRPYEEVSKEIRQQLRKKYNLPLGE